MIESIQEHIKGVVKTSAAIHQNVSSLVTRADPRDIESITHHEWWGSWMFTDDLKHAVVDDEWINQKLVRSAK